MIRQIPSIKSWRHIFLDTSTIIDLSRDYSLLKEDDPVYKRIALTHELFNRIWECRTQEKREIFYYVSAITLGELLRADSRNIRMSIMTILKSQNVVFLDYSREIATDLNKNLNTFIPTRERAIFEKDLQKKLRDQNVTNIREWIKDDYKICFIAKSVSKLDVLLTADSRTFLPIAQALDLPCISTTNAQLARDAFGELVIDVPFIIR